MTDSQPQRPRSLRDRFNGLAMQLTLKVGSPFALMVAFGLIVVWALTGPIFGFSDTWQLFINTTTTIITFLMVFVIQASQNRDSKALHLKLDEMIRSSRGARNDLIGAEQSTEDELLRREQEFLTIAAKGGAAAVAVAGVADAPKAEVARKVVASEPVRAAVRHAARQSVAADKGAVAAGKGAVAADKGAAAAAKVHRRGKGGTAAAPSGNGKGGAPASPARNAVAQPAESSAGVPRPESGRIDSADVAAPQVPKR